MAAGSSIDPLCCCEYQNRRGERAHLLGLCCDCEDLDRVADSLIFGRSVDRDRMAEVLRTAEDRIRIPWPGGAIHPPLDKAMGVVVVPGGLWLCSIHPMVMVVVLCLLPPLLHLLARALLRVRPQNKLCLWLAYTSAAHLIYIYEVKLVGLFWDLPKVVSPLENLLLVCGAGASLWFFYCLKCRATRPRKQSGEEGEICRICGLVSIERDHHCVWLDVCISSSNRVHFLSFLLVTSLTALHLALILSSAACPGYLLGPVLLPGLCWPEAALSRVFLVSGGYSGLISLLLLLLLIEQVTRSWRHR